MIKSNRRDRRLHGLNLSLKHLVALKVYAEQLRIITNKKKGAEPSGTQASATHARGMDFSEVRSYQAGDDIRNMDWRVTARTGKPHTKLFREEREQPIYILLNLSNSMQFGSRVTFKSIVAAQIAALLAWKTVLNKDRLGGYIDNGHTSYFAKPLSGNRSIMPMLQKIITLNNLRPSELERNYSSFEGLMKYHAALKQGNQLFIISDFNDFSEKEQALYARLATHNQLHFMHIYDGLEAEPPKPNIYSVTDGRKLFEFDSSSIAFQQNYKKLFQEHVEHLKQFCVKRKINFISIRTDDDAVTVLQRVK